MRATLALALVAAVWTLAVAADYDPGFRPVRLYDRTRPETAAEVRMRREERAVLRVHGMRARPFACEFRKAYQYLPYDRWNLVLECPRAMSIYR